MSDHAIAERVRVARKSHRCDAGGCAGCVGWIRSGEQYTEAKTPPSHHYWPGSWNTWRQCAFCKPISPSVPSSEGEQE